MAKKRKGEVDSIDDLIYHARKAGLESIAEQAEGLKVYFDALKKINADKRMTFEEFLNLPKGEKYIFVCFQNDHFSFSDIEEKGDVDITKNKLEFSTSSGDPTIEFDSLTDEVHNIPDLSDDEYRYTIYSILTRKKKIKKLLDEN